MIIYDGFPLILYAVIKFYKFNIFIEYFYFKILYEEFNLIFLRLRILNEADILNTLEVISTSFDIYRFFISLYNFKMESK